MRITLHARSPLLLLLILTLISSSGLLAQDAEIDSVRAFLIQTFEPLATTHDSPSGGSIRGFVFAADTTPIIPLRSAELELLLPQLRFYQTNAAWPDMFPDEPIEILVAAVDSGSRTSYVHSAWPHWKTFLLDILMSRIYERADRARLVAGLSKIAMPDAEIVVKNRTTKCRSYFPCDGEECALITGTFDDDGNLLLLDGFGNANTGYAKTGTSSNGPVNAYSVPLFLRTPEADQHTIDSFLQRNYPPYDVGESSQISYSAECSMLYYLREKNSSFETGRSLISRRSIGVLDTIAPNVRIYHVPFIFLLGDHFEQRTLQLAVIEGESQRILLEELVWPSRTEAAFLLQAYSSVRFESPDLQRRISRSLIERYRPYPFGIFTIDDSDGCMTATLTAARRTWKLRVCFDEKGRLAAIDSEGSSW